MDSWISLALFVGVNGKVSPSSTCDPVHQSLIPGVNSAFELYRARQIFKPLICYSMLYWINPGLPGG